MTKTASARRARYDTTPRVDVYRSISDVLSQTMADQGGLVPSASPSVLPVNAVSGLPYRGISATSLMTALGGVSEHGDPRFATYRAAKHLGWQVRQGEKALGYAVAYKKVVVRRKDDGPDSDDADDEFVNTSADGQKHVLLARRVPLFHVSQMLNVPGFRNPEPLVDSPYAEIESMFDSMAADNNLMSRATVDRMLDPDHKASEMIRQMVWFSPDMARERVDILTSDLATAIIEAEFGLPHRPVLRSLFGVGSEDVMKKAIEALTQMVDEDPRLLFRLAAQAQRVADSCLAASPAFAARAVQRATRFETFRDEMSALAVEQAASGQPVESLDDLFSDIEDAALPVSAPAAVAVSVEPSADQVRRTPRGV